MTLGATLGRPVRHSPGKALIGQVLILAEPCSSCYQTLKPWCDVPCAHCTCEGRVAVLKFRARISHGASCGNFVESVATIAALKTSRGSRPMPDVILYQPK